MKLFTLVALGVFLFSLMPGKVSASPYKLSSFSQYDLDGDGTKDKVVIKATLEDEIFAQDLQVYVEGKKAGQTAVKDFLAADTSCEMVKTRSGDLFLMVNSAVMEDDPVFVLFQYQKGSFEVVLTSEQVIEAKRYILSSESISYKKGKSAKGERFIVRSIDTSQSLGYHNSDVVYIVKDHQLVKKSQIYKTKSMGGHSVYTLRKSRRAYASPTAKKKAFSLKKGDQIKVTKIYDSPKKLRLYFKRVSDGKKGWIDGVPNYQGGPIFREIDEDVLYN